MQNGKSVLIGLFHHNDSWTPAYIWSRVRDTGHLYINIIPEHIALFLYDWSDEHKHFNR